MQLLPAAPFNPPIFSDFRQLPLQPGNFLLHAPAIHFQLRFARAPAADTAPLPREMGPHSGQARQHVVELGQLHLNLALPRPGTLRKNIENEFGAIEHLHIGAKNFAKIAALSRRQIVIENYRVGGQSLTAGGNFVGLPLAHKRRCTRCIAFLGQQFEDGHPGRFRKLPKFSQ